MQITFNNTSLNLVEHTQHEFLLSNKEVALGYGIKLNTLATHKNEHQDELLENKHWLRLEVQTKGGKQKVIHWTKKGIVRLGFFIKSQQAKAFRDWAEDYIVDGSTTTPPNEPTPYIYQLERENIELRRAINRLSAQPTHSDELKKLKNENKHIKQTLADFSNRYHNIVSLAENKTEAIKQELLTMTNVFQTIKSIETNNKNLNTSTTAKLKYW